MDISLKTAFEYANKNCIEAWVVNLLITSNNDKFAKRIQGQGIWIGPQKFDLDKLKRVCGPEDGMIFKEDVIDWEKRLEKMVSSIKKGWDIPPLIIWYLNDELSVADGAHRITALKRAGFKEYWCFVWFESQKDYDKFLSKSET